MKRANDRIPRGAKTTGSAAGHAEKEVPDAQMLFQVAGIARGMSSAYLAMLPPLTNEHHELLLSSIEHLQAASSNILFSLEARRMRLS